MAPALIANFMSVGTGFYMFNVFLKPMCELHPWTRTQANLALILATAAGLGLIFLQDHRTALFLFIIVFGFAMGGVTSTFPGLIAELYGRAPFASVARPSA